MPPVPLAAAILPVAAQSDAVLAIAIDDLDSVIASLGPAIGLRLMDIAANRITGALPGMEPERLSSNEFLVSLTRERAHEPAETASYLADLLERSYIIDGNLVDVTIRIGVALTPPEGADRDQMIRRAKLAGNNAHRAPGHFRLYEPSMDTVLQERRGLESDLRRALALREFEIVYQPQCNVVERRITGFEALLRWNSEKRGTVMPAGFLPLAEEVGLIVPIGKWVMRHACRAAATWPEHYRVAVNVSARQFEDGRIAEMVADALKESGLDPKRLEIEITESVFLNAVNPVLADLELLREMGVRVAMDDFGTGYSSLSYLRTFPFDKIKIDRSFLHVAPEESIDRTIVRAVAAVGRILGATITAEGIETEEQRAQAASDGCTEIQGYLIGRPISRADVLSFTCPTAL